MAKMMVYLGDEDHEALRRIAYEQRISIAEHIRRAVRLYLSRAVTTPQTETTSPKKAKGQPARTRQPFTRKEG